MTTDAQMRGDACADCGVPLALDADVFAIDCGQVVCQDCGEQRGLGDDYKLGPWAD